MSKELEALESLFCAGRLDLDYVLNGKQNKDYKIIETALKRLEQQDDMLKILKEVIGFKIALPYIEPNIDNGFDIMSAVGINIQRSIENKERELLRQWVLETCFPKELKALEIIKEKGVNVGLLSRCANAERYNKGICYEPRYLTQEEFDLLKEALLWD